MSGRVRKGFLLTVAASLVMALGGNVASADAVTYYVSPTGSGINCTQMDPCFITEADSTGPGSEVVIAPGDYMVGAQQLSYLNQTNIHGVAGQPRPRIFSTHGFAAMDLGLNANMTLRHVEVHTTGLIGISVNGPGTSTVDDVIVSNTGANGTGCATPVYNGGSVTFRNSICTGPTRGLGVTCACNGMGTISLRNVTAIGGTNGIAIESAQGAGSPTDYNVTATNVIARHSGMTGADVRAQGGTADADVAITLNNSNYATEEEAVFGGPPGTATVTDPGTGTGNQTAAPMFVDAAAGDFHQALGSPTIGGGVNDPLNDTADIDGQQREIDTVDIGADERGRDPTTTVACTPGSTPPAMFVMCTGTVTDGGASPTVPTGLLAFNSDGIGSFGFPSCTLAATTVAGQSACSVSYLPSQTGTHQITAMSFRDLTHEGSQGAFGLAVAAAPTPQTAPAPTRKKKCKRKKRRAGKKCKKKR